ncbi:trypsin-like serine peptidase [Alkalinema pantanalense]|uniref:trypsin-like serine peptidase n=1 Tax=Alkalinema pantanalense TaxID=1620705 RepID=UPI003D6FC116
MFFPQSSHAQTQEPIPNKPPIGVIGQDDRVTPSYSWMKRNKRKAVGQLEIQKADGQFYSCTFTVVGTNLGLTNTHCLLDDEGNGPLQVKAYAISHGSRYYKAANVDVFWTGLDFSPKTVGDYRRDWAIVRFNRSLGKSTGWFGQTNWSTDINQAGLTAVGKKVNLIGYSGDWPTAEKAQLGDIKGQTPGAHFNCNFLSVDIGLIIHDCDGTPGSSGTGIHTRNRKLQGMQVATVFDPKTQITLFSLAVPIDRFMPAIETLRKTKGAGSTIVPRV